MIPRLALLPGVLALALPAAAQVESYYGPSANLATALDFDSPQFPIGPLAPNDPGLVALGIASISIVGTAQPGTGDVLTQGENVNGRSLIVQNGALAVGEVGAAVQGFTAGNGIEFALVGPVEEFQVLLADVRGIEYDVDLYLGTLWLGRGQFIYDQPGAAIPPHFWRAIGSSFDRVVVTFPTESGGIGFDEIAFGDGPAPTPTPSDECGDAFMIPAGVSGVTYFTHRSTASQPPMVCSPTAGVDHWARYVVQEHRNVEISGSASGLAALEVYTGSCDSLTSVACVTEVGSGGNPRVLLPDVVAGDEFVVRVGSERSVRGTVGVSISGSFIDPTPVNCVDSRFRSTTPGALGGAVYFDLRSSLPITIAGLKTNSSHPAGTPVGLEVWVTPGSRVGNESNPAAWTRVAIDDGQSISEGPGRRTPVEFLQPFDLAPGSYGIAMVGANPANGRMTDFRSSDLTADNEFASSYDGVLSLQLGASSDVPFTGSPVEGQVWNGRLCYTKNSLGTNYCGPAVQHNDGYPAWMCANGSLNVASNDFVIGAIQLPLNSFGFFIVSQTQGMIPMAGGSFGTLCLGGSIGRYVAPGQIMSSGASGQISLPIDLAQTPTPSGLIQVAAGETWNFQCWFRDVYEFGVFSNFTDGLEITFE